MDFRIDFISFQREYGIESKVLNQKGETKLSKPYKITHKLTPRILIRFK